MFIDFSINRIQFTKKIKAHFLVSLSLLVLVVSFQNCSNRFQTNDAATGSKVSASSTSDVQRSWDQSYVGTQDYYYANPDRFAQDIGIPTDTVSTKEECKITLSAEYGADGYAYGTILYVDIRRADGSALAATDKVIWSGVHNSASESWQRQDIPSSTVVSTQVLNAKYNSETSKVILNYNSPDFSGVYNVHFIVKDHSGTDLCSSINHSTLLLYKKPTYTCSLTEKENKLDVNFKDEVNLDLKLTSSVPAGLSLPTGNRFEIVNDDPNITWLSQTPDDGALASYKTVNEAPVLSGTKSIHVRVRDKYGGTLCLTDTTFKLNFLENPLKQEGWLPVRDYASGQSMYYGSWSFVYDSKALFLRGNNSTQFFVYSPVSDLWKTVVLPNYMWPNSTNGTDLKIRQVYLIGDYFLIISNRDFDFSNPKVTMLDLRTMNNTTPTWHQIDSEIAKKYFSYVQTGTAYDGKLFYWQTTIDYAYIFGLMSGDFTLALSGNDYYHGFAKPSTEPTSEIDRRYNMINMFDPNLYLSARDKNASFASAYINEKIGYCHNQKVGDSKECSIYVYKEVGNVNYNLSLFTSRRQVGEDGFFSTARALYLKSDQFTRNASRFYKMDQTLANNLGTYTNPSPFVEKSGNGGNIIHITYKPGNIGKANALVFENQCVNYNPDSTQKSIKDCTIKTLLGGSTFDPFNFDSPFDGASASLRTHTPLVKAQNGENIMMYAFVINQGGHLTPVATVLNYNMLTRKLTLENKPELDPETNIIDYNKLAIYSQPRMSFTNIGKKLFVFGGLPIGSAGKGAVNTWTYAKDISDAYTFVDPFSTEDGEVKTLPSSVSVSNALSIEVDGKHMILIYGIHDSNIDFQPVYYRYIVPQKLVQ